MTRHSAAAGEPTGLTSAGGGVILSATITGDLQHMATLNKDDLAADLLGNLDQLTAAEARRTVDRPPVLSYARLDRKCFGVISANDVQLNLF